MVFINHVVKPYTKTTVYWERFGYGLNMANRMVKPYPTRISSVERAVPLLCKLLRYVYLGLHLVGIWNVCGSSVTSSVTWPFDSLCTIFYRCSIGIDTLSLKDFEILRTKYIGVMTLTFKGHVTSSVTWRLDSHCDFLYVLIDTDPLSWTVFEILNHKRIRVVTLTF